MALMQHSFLGICISFHLLLHFSPICTLKLSYKSEPFKGFKGLESVTASLTRFERPLAEEQREFEVLAASRRSAIFKYY